VYTDPWPARLLEPLVVSIERGFAGKQRANGTMHLGWLAESAAFDDFAFAEQTMKAGASLVPALADVPVRRVVTGTYDMTPDHRPILGRVGAHRDLFVAAGFSGHGYMVAPAVGAGLAALVAADETDPALASFLADRFASGTVKEGLQI
jgi:sarcosine oxidase subunit beta